MAINGINVLLCDDHPMVRMGFKQLLESVPDIVVAFEAETGEEACQLYRKHQPSLVILDINMPGMGGFAAARYILEGDSSAKIMMLSMYDSKSFVGRAIKLGVKGYLTKRAEPDELIKAVRLVDRGRTYIEPSIAQDLVMSNMTGEKEPIDILSPREFEVFTALADGQSVKCISSSLNLSPKTVGVHRTNIMKKLCMDNLADITRLAIRHGVITA